MPKPKAKTFWVSLKVYDVLGKEVVTVMGKVRVGELKQFKIVEVKSEHER